MADESAQAGPRGGGSVKAWLRQAWKRVIRSRVAGRATIALATATLRTLRATNPPVAGSMVIVDEIKGHEPVIFAVWHGQHLLTPCFYPRGKPLAAMVSKSSDGELNAGVFESLGFHAVRGSGGRGGDHRVDKGGARALIALKRQLDAGVNVALIADIVHGTPREAGLGIVTLAKISGRPIFPLATVTSRRRVLEKTWDKTTLHLPFGRSAVQLGAPIYIPANASDAEMEAGRQQVTRAIDDVLAKAYRLVDAGR